MSTPLHEYLRIYLFLIPLVVLILTECTKVTVEWARTGQWHRKLFRHGGMPSSHSAFVTSLLIVVWHKTGLESVEFAITACFAAIVWYDAFAVRGEVGRQAQALNVLQKINRLSEDIGHTFVQVIAGIAFGGVITMIGIWVS